MRITVVSDVLGTKAGANLATLLLCRALEKLDITITCFTTWVEPELPVSSEGFTVVKPIMTKGYRWDWPNRCLAVQTIRHIKKTDTPLVIVMGVTRISRYLLSSSIANRLLIWELTDACGNKFVDVLAGKLLSRCKAMLSPSMTVDRNIRKHYEYNGAIIRCPFWVEDQDLQFMPRPESFLADFIFFGRRDDEKGLTELVQATAILAKEYPDVKVIIGGVGDEEPFASQANLLDIEKNIVFGSFLTRRDVEAALASSRCLVLPSYHEGYPLVLLEAARSSLPFIASDVGSIREVFGESDACIIIEPKNSESLAQGMDKMLSESDVAYNDRKKASYEIFKRISSSEQVAEYLKGMLQLAR